MSLDLNPELELEMEAESGPGSDRIVSLALRRSLIQQRARSNGEGENAMENGS